MSSNPLENSNIDELLSDQSALGESTTSKMTAPKPKQPSTHHDSAHFVNTMIYLPNGMNLDQVYSSQYYPRNMLGGSSIRTRTLSGSSTSLSSREHNAALTKTKICDHWRRSGSCSYGDACWYAHGEDDLRKMGMMRPSRMDDNKTNKENETPVQFRRSPTVSPVEVLEFSKQKEDVPRAPPKRASTNLKGLTVSIPQNITFKEQANDSMPLSPAQERWISMSCGANGNTGEKSNESIVPMSNSNSVIPKNEMIDHDFDKKMPMENMYQKRQMSGQLPRDDDFNQIDDIPNFLSPTFLNLPQPTFPGRLPPSQSAGAFHSQNPHNPRSYSRGPNRMMQSCGGSHTHSQQSSQPPRPSRPINGTSTGYLNSGYNNDRSTYGNPHRSASSIRNSMRESLHSGHPQIPQMQGSSSNKGPQYQQAIWNVAGEIYQRQKDIETVGFREQQMQSQHHQKRNDELEAQRIMSKFSKMNMANLRYMFDRGLLNERQVPKEIWMELISNPPIFNQSLSQTASQFGQNNNNSGNHDCHCGASRPREHTSLQSRFTQYQQSPQQTHQHLPQHPLHLQQHMMSHQQHNPSHVQPQFRRSNQQFPMGLNSAPAELTAPPKMFESLLPSENFSIWLDPKPKKETSEFIRSPTTLPESSESSISLLAKMDVLRSEKFPMTAEEYAASNGPSPAAYEKIVSSESVSPPALSLMELLSSENLFEPRVIEKPKTTMFDFDTLKIAETLRMTPPASSHQNLPSGKIASPMFFIDEKTPGYDDDSALFTPISSKKPNFLEMCDFFTAGGTCPFGDGCTLSHSIPEELKAL